MTEMTTYFCENCGDTFDNPTDCERHELICAVVEQVSIGDLHIFEKYTNIGRDIEAEMPVCEVSEMLNNATRIVCKTENAYLACNSLLEYLGFEELCRCKDTVFPATFIWNDDLFFWEDSGEAKPVATTNLASADAHEAILLQIEALLEELSPAELASLSVVIAEKVAENF